MGRTSRHLTSLLRRCRDEPLAEPRYKEKEEMAKKGQNTYGMCHCSKKTARSMGCVGGNNSTGHGGDHRKQRGNNL